MNRPDVIDRLRAAFPSTLGRGLARLDLRTRRVCDGVAVLEAAEHRPAELSQLGVASAQLAALAELAAAVDALADLHVAEATLGVVKGRPAVTSAATTAAAGQAPPPDFEVVRTPRGGRVVNTVALVILPGAAPPTGARPSPAAVADPAVAAYLDERCGDPAGADWIWVTLDATGTPVGAVSLADVGLRPCDTVGLGIGGLRDVVRDVSGAAALGPEDPPGHAMVRELATALAGVPAQPEDVGAPADLTAAATAELAQRYTKLRDAAVAAAADARTASAPAATEARRRAALGRLARWGITPLFADTDDPTVGGSIDRVRRGAEALERRIADSPATLSDATVSELASAIGSLVAPEGGVPGLRPPAGGRVRRHAHRAGGRGHGAAPGPGLAGDGGARPAGARAPRGRPARRAHRDRWTTAPDLDEPSRRSVADDRPAAFGHRGRASVPTRRGVRPGGRASRRGRPRRRREQSLSP